MTDLPSAQFTAAKLREAITALRAAWHQTRKGPANKLRDREIRYEWTSILAQAVDLFDRHPDVLGLGFDKRVGEDRMVSRVQRTPSGSEHIDPDLETRMFELSRNCTTLVRGSNLSTLAGQQLWSWASGEPGVEGHAPVHLVPDAWIRPEALWPLLAAVAGKELAPLVHEAWLQSNLPSGASAAPRPRM